MKKLLALFALIAFAMPAMAQKPHPLEGRWKEGNLEIRIAPCGSMLCGTVVAASEKQKARAKKGSGIDLVGSTLIRDIQPTGKPGHYKGKVFVADRNMNASGSIQQLAPNRIKVKGCVVLGIFCKAEEWVRVGD